ncbi:DsbA family protein [Streptomyces hydrogenans]|uniref:DsbA family protein n=1 Tax=Streptomyces hydrogenans TaxID=1873719 RepID=UPI00343EDF84
MRTTPASPSTARDRLREQRHRQALRTYRLHVAAKSVGLCVALAAVIGVSIALQSRAADEGPVVSPAGAVGDEGLLIPVGRKDAPVVITVYEDARCPGCAQLEKTLHTTVNRLEDEGLLRVEYHVLSFVDRIVGGKGSKVAANALAAAQDAGRFREFHDVLFAHPPAEESSDAFADRDFLLELAGRIPGLRSAGFDKAVAEGTHSGWAKAVQRRFDQQTDVQATPAVLLDGKDLVRDQEHPLTPERLTELVDEAAARKGAAGRTTRP